MHPSILIGSPLFSFLFPFAAILALSFGHRWGVRELATVDVSAPEVSAGSVAWTYVGRQLMVLGMLGFAGMLLCTTVVLQMMTAVTSSGGLFSWVNALFGR